MDRGGARLSVEPDLLPEVRPFRRGIDAEGNLRGDEFPVPLEPGQPVEMPQAQGGEGGALSRKPRPSRRHLRIQYRGEWGC